MSRCYDALCRWYPDGPVGWIRFYRVPETNHHLTTANRFWPFTQKAEIRNTDTGEQVIEGRILRRYYNGANPFPELDGSHPCGTEDDFLGRTPLPAGWENGTPLEALCDCTLPVGYPVFAPDLDWGGEDVGGAVVAVWTSPLAQEGGEDMGGSVSLVWLSPVAVSGGEEVGGSTTALWWSPLGSGGEEVGGSVGLEWATPLATDGCEEVGGSVVLEWTSPVAREGGEEVGGNAASTWTSPLASAGGSENGGSVELFWFSPVALAGGEEVNGTSLLE